jgi:hypothetical protein
VVVAASLALALIAVGPVSAGTPQRVANPQAPEATGAASEIGQWTHPFEEGGAGTPRCHRRDALLKGEIFCKVAAVTMAALPDGRIYYANGIEADENVKYHYELELGDRTRADRVRVMDLRGPEAKWTIPAAEAGASWNPQVKPGRNSFNGDPFGVVGAPGRPGDGFVGSKWGKLGGPPQEPSSPPDDKPYKERSTFCADIAQLGDGRMLMAGGTDYYNEPSLMDRDEGAPADVGVLELEGLRASWIFDPKDDSHTATAPMKYGRWYPSLVTMPDGKVTVFSGVTKLLKSTQMGQVRRTETFDPATNTWTENYVGDESETALPLFSRLTLMPNGKVLFNGVGQNFGPNGTDFEEATFNFQKMWDPATKKWEIVGPALLGSRGSAAQVMLPLKAPYNEGSIITFGGTIGIPPGEAMATNLSTVTTVTKGGKVTKTRSRCRDTRSPSARPSSTTRPPTAGRPSPPRRGTGTTTRRRPCCPTAASSPGACRAWPPCTATAATRATASSPTTRRTRASRSTARPTCSGARGRRSPPLLRAWRGARSSTSTWSARTRSAALP